MEFRVNQQPGKDRGCNAAENEQIPHVAGLTYGILDSGLGIDTISIVMLGSAAVLIATASVRASGNRYRRWIVYISGCPPAP